MGIVDFWMKSNYKKKWFRFNLNHLVVYDLTKKTSRYPSESVRVRNSFTKMQSSHNSTESHEKSRSKYFWKTLNYETQSQKQFDLFLSTFVKILRKKRRRIRMKRISEAEWVKMIIQLILDNLFDYCTSKSGSLSITVNCLPESAGLSTRWIPYTNRRTLLGIIDFFCKKFRSFYFDYCNNYQSNHTTY